MNYKRIIETVLLACDTPISISRIKQIIGELDINDKDIIEIIEKLNKEYKQNKKGIYVDSVSNGYQIRTLPEFHKYIRIANNSYPKHRLSKPALEVLSIISFKQPISKLDIEFQILE